VGRNNARKEVPTVSNIILHGPSAAIARSGSVACPLGAWLPGGATARLAGTTDVFTATPPSTVTGAKTAQPTKINYQDKTRISAAGSGVTGSPPTWDPV
jgi:hypothetical protein